LTQLKIAHFREKLAIGEDDEVRRIAANKILPTRGRGDVTMVT
jgi:hypothetical protein